MDGPKRICAMGETFDSIALEIFGDERYAAELLAANPLLARITVFSGGEALTLPEVDTPDEDEEEEEEGAMPVTAPWKE